MCLCNLDMSGILPRITMPVTPSPDSYMVGIIIMEVLAYRDVLSGLYEPDE